MADFKTPDDLERESRAGLSAGGAAPAKVAGTHAAAPSTPHVIALSTWVEVKLLNDRGKPLCDEPCELYLQDGTCIEKKTGKKDTDKAGIVRFDNLPVEQTRLKPALVLPDVLEEWSDKPPGSFGKNKGKRDDYRKGDGRVHFVPTETPGYEIYVEQLSAEEKYQHFRHAYVDAGAVWGSPKERADRDYGTADRRWNWKNGATCNQHINFFLGYWYNYNSAFTTQASNTFMHCLSLYDSSLQRFQDCWHRGYLEFLEPVRGFGRTYKQKQGVDYAERSTFPSSMHHGSADMHIDYIRVSKYWNRDGTPKARPAGEKTANDIIAELAEFNVYSLSSWTKEKNHKTGTVTDNVRVGLDAVKTWLGQHGKPGATDDDARTALWDLDEGPVDNDRLLHRLFDLLNRDHHCGILLKRAKGDKPLGGELEAVQLFTFSADGSPGNYLKIRQKTFAEFLDHHKDKKDDFVHLGIWRLKPIRLGGWAPRVALADDPDAVAHKVAKVDLDMPPRFIKFKPP